MRMSSKSMPSKKPCIGESDTRFFIYNWLTLRLQLGSGKIRTGQQVDQSSAPSATAAARAATSLAWTSAGACS